MMPVKHNLCLAGVIFLLSLTFEVFAAEEGVGNITAVLGNVDIIEAKTKQKKSAKKDTVLYENDVIQTQVDAKAKVILNDQTVLSLGPEAELVIDKFVMGNESNKGSVGVSVKKGLLKYLSGDISKNKGDVQLKIPNAVITVRGTSGIINIAVDGTASIKTLTGELRLTNAAGITTQITAGFVIEFNSQTSTVTNFSSFASGCNA